MVKRNKARCLVLKFLTGAWLLLAAMPAFAQKFTVQGKLTDGNGTSLTSNHVSIRVKIYTPSSFSNSCVLYDETQIVDLSQSNGLFSLELNSGAGTRNAPTTHTFDQAIRNSGALALDTSYCGSFSPAVFTPSASDNRRIEISFRDTASGSSMSSFETIPQFDINPVPYAMDSANLGGYPVNTMLRVANFSATDSDTLMSSTDLTDLKAIIGGTSTKYVARAAGGGAVLPSYSSLPSAMPDGAIWLDSTTGKLNYSTGGTPKVLDSTGVSGTVQTVNAGAGLSNSGTTTDVTIRMPTLGAGGTFGDAANVPRITFDTFGRITGVVSTPITGILPSGASGQFLKFGSAWTSADINLADLKSTAGGALFDSPSCAANQSIFFNSGTSKFECQAIGNLPVAALPNSPVTPDTYQSVTVDSKGRVTSGTKPTTIAGYNITDAILNGGTARVLSAGTALPSDHVAGRVFVDATNQNISYDNGAAWVTVGANTSNNFSGSLAGDVTGTQSATVVGRVGGSGGVDAATVISGVSAANSAASANTASTIVRRDASGNFFAGTGTFAGTILRDGTTGNTVTLTAPTTAFTNFTMRLPSSSGSANQVLSSNGAGGLTWATPFSTGSITVAAPITNVSNTIGITQATTSANGYLSSTDWNTFNSKQAAGNYVTALTGDVTSSAFTAGSITATIAANAVTTAKINDAAVATSKIADGAVSTLKLADASVSNVKIADTAVGTSKLADASVTAIKIADGNITTAKIADANVTTLKIADSNVTTAKIADNAITTLKIADSNVTTSKLNNLAVTDAKINDVAVGKITSATGQYFSYRPNGTACAAGQFLTWDNTNSRWICGTATSTETDPTVAAFAKNAPSSDFTTPSNVLTLSTVGVAKGGTGLTAIGSSNQVLGVNNAGTALEYKSVTAGTGVTVNNSAGALTISATGSGGTVTSVGVAVPSFLTSSGGPVTTSGNITLGLASQAAYTAFIAPAAGGTPTFRTLSNSDVRSTSAGSFIVPATCPSGQMLTWLSGSDNISCQPYSITNAQALAGIGYTPVNRAGDTMTGTLNLPSNGLVVGTNQLAANGGNIGIGSAAPGVKLDVNGTLRISDGGETCTGGAGGGMIRYSSTALQFCNGTSWQTLGISGAGLTSLNGITNSTQTFALGTAGNAPAFNSAGTVHTLNIPMASTASVTAGLLSKTDYDSFTAKQAAGNYITTLTGDITTSGFAAGSAAATIANNAVTTAKINDGAVSTSKLADGSVSTVKLADGSVSTTKLSDGSVTSLKLADGSVSTLKLADDAVTTVKILDANVTTSKLANLAVTNAKIADVAVNKITSAAGQYFTYAPNGAACAAGQFLSWDNTNSHWICGSALSSESDPTVQAWAKSAPAADFTTSGSVLGLATVGIAKGGTGLTAPGTSNQFLGMNNAGTAYEYKSITAGAGVTLTPSAGGLAISATGSGGTVTSVDVAVPSYMTSSGGPITSTGSIALGFGTQTARTVFAAPAAGGAPTFRNLNSADIRSTTAGAFFNLSTPCAAGEMLTYSQTNDNITCQPYTVGSSQITAGLGYTPVNKAGDTMTGSLTLPSAGLTVGTNDLRVGSGQVGIGSASPSSVLDVRENASSTAALFRLFGSGDGSQFSSVKLGDLASSHTWDISHRVSNHNLLFVNYDGASTRSPLQLQENGGVAIGNGYAGAFQAPANGLIVASAVGIGTTSPSGSLHVESSAAAAAVIARVKNSDDTGYATLSVDNDYTNLNLGLNGSNVATLADRNLAFLSNHANGGMAFSTNSAERLRISAAGNIGVGLSSPSARLHLPAGTATGSTAPLKFTAGTLLGTEENGAMEYDGSIFYLTTGGVRFSIPLAGGAVAYSSVAVANGSAGSPSFGFSGDADTGFFHAGADSVGVAAGGAEIFHFDSVGMNSSASGGASVRSGAGSAGNPTFGFAGSTGLGWYRAAADTLAASTASNERLRIDSSGRVGINSSSPTTTLDVNGSARVSDSITPTAGAGMELSYSSGTGVIQAYDRTGAAQQALSLYGSVLAFFNANSEVMRVQGNSVAIGTSTPTGTLTVKQNSAAGGLNLAGSTGVDSGNATMKIASSSANGNWGLTAENSAGNFSINDLVNSRKPFSIEPNANNNSLYVKAAGLVGIGTNNPTSTLHVQSSSVGALIKGENTTATSYASVRTVNDSARLLESGITGSSFAGGEGPNTGFIYTDSPNGLRFETNGSDLRFATNPANPDVMRVLANGNVGIGTLGPGVPLDIYSPANASMRVASPSGYARLILQYDAGATQQWDIRTGSAANVGAAGNFSINDNNAGASRLAIDTTGQVGIGTNVPREKLHVYDGGILAAATTAISPSASSGHGFRVVSDSNATIISNGETTDASMYINKTGPAAGASFIAFNVAGSVIGAITSPGGTTVAYNTTSDRRVKENIRDSSRGLDTLLHLKVHDYNYRKDAKKIDQQGFIAQEVKDIYPEAVTTNGDDGKGKLAEGKTPWAVEYGRLTPLLVKSVQDLYEMIMGSKATISKLEAENARLKKADEAKARDIASIKAEAQKAKLEAQEKAKELSELKARMDRLEKRLSR
jgi:hypothetical protein